MTAEVPAVELAGFGLELGGRSLLAGVDLVLPRGAFALIVGPSGSGKSALLSVLACLPLPPPRGLRLEGGARVLGLALPLEGQRPPVGIVFQDYALFDEWGARDNLRFAREHGRAGRADAAADAQLLESLGIAAGLDLRTASGGQRQRVAIARALAQEPELLLFDEPTSGLDPALARRVAELIGEVHRRRGQTTLVITHDPEPFRGQAGTLLLLDPVRRALRPIAWEARETELAALAGATSAPAQAEHRPSPALAALGEATADIARVLAFAPTDLWPRWPRASWGLRFLGRALRVAHGGTSLIYIGLAGAIGGFVAAFFGLTHLPLKAFLAPLVLDDVIAALGFALFRVVIPVLATLLIAARSGAAIAADLGAWSYTRRLATMASFGVPPARYLRTAYALVLCLGTPLLTLWAFAVARAVATMVYAYTQSDPALIFFDRHFTRLLETGGLWVGSGWFLGKTLACGLGTAALASFIGEAPKHTAQDVSRGVTAAILATTLWVLLVHFVASLMEF